MTVYSTLDKLDEMKMTAMCDVYRFQLEDSTVHSLSLDERFVMLVDDQFISRQKYRGSFTMSSLTSHRPVSQASNTYMEES